MLIDDDRGQRVRVHGLRDVFSTSKPTASPR
jgi:hypothetical protein